MPKTPASASLELAGALGHSAADKRVEILRRVGEGGSISQAARDAGVSYKAAWQALDTLSNLAGAALVERAVGGSGGGGAHLTPAGRRLLEAADALVRARDEVLARLAGQRRQDGPAGAGNAQAPALAALTLRTSMRNQLPCTVQALRRNGAAVEVLLALGDKAPGDKALAPLVSRITRESAQLLGLRPGAPVLALFKAAAVTVHAGEAVAEGTRETGGTPAEDGGNLLPGRVTRASRATAGGEVALQLDSGLAIVGFAGGQSGLRVGRRAVACVQASAVALAVAG